MKIHAFAAALFLLTLPCTAQQIQISKENKTIAITTNGTADALADTAVISVGFSSYGKTQDQTYADATVTSNAIMHALTQGGVPKEVIASTEQKLSPLDPDSGEEKVHYAEGMRFGFTQS